MHSLAIVKPCETHGVAHPASIMKTAFSLCLAVVFLSSARAQMFRPEAVNGAVLGGIAGAVIGNNSGDLRHNAWKGAAIGSAAGLVLGEAVGNANAARNGQVSAVGDRGYVYRNEPAVQFGVSYGRGGYGHGYDHYRGGRGSVGFGFYGPRYGYGYYPGYSYYSYPSYGYYSGDGDDYSYYGTTGYYGNRSYGTKGFFVGAVAGGNNWQKNRPH